ncbi:MAG: hypothetical protein KDD50_07400, partial [Bdellovibrionales bacterium]|nr:hypothetical protein [Bdellovibrionales bacterium]
MTFTVFTSRSKKRIRSILFFIFFGFLSINLISCKGGSGGSEENVINANVVANIKALDSIYISDTYSNAVASQIYESLYNYHYLKRPLELQPRLAEALPSVSKDGLTYTIKIKKGIKFQDSEVFPKGKGRELVANDFIYAWKRLADPQNKSDGFWIFDGKIKGLDKWRDNLSNNKGK